QGIPQQFNQSMSQAIPQQLNQSINQSMSQGIPQQIPNNPQLNMSQSIQQPMPNNIPLNMSQQMMPQPNIPQNLQPNIPQITQPQLPPQIPSEIDLEKIRREEKLKEKRKEWQKELDELKAGWAKIEEERRQRNEAQYQSEYFNYNLSLAQMKEFREDQLRCWKVFNEKEFAWRRNEVEQLRLKKEAKRKANEEFKRKQIEKLQKYKEITKLADEQFLKYSQEIINEAKERNKTIEENAKTIAQKQKNIEEIQKLTAQLQEEGKKLSEENQKMEKEIKVQQIQRKSEEMFSHLFGVHVVQSDIRSSNQIFFDLVIYDKIHLEFLCTPSFTQRGQNIEIIEINSHIDFSHYFQNKPQLMKLFNDTYNKIREENILSKGIHPLNEFEERFKALFKFSGSFMYLFLYIQQIISLTEGYKFQFDLEKNVLQSVFSITNKNDISFNFAMEFDLIDPFNKVAIRELKVEGQNTEAQEFKDAKTDAEKFFKEISTYFRYKGEKGEVMPFRDIILKIQKKFTQ
ncbi:MAG: hypothetical protein MJ252_29720, partial [archaeon]|nr:hypothetical protein [archaeon]